MQAETYAVYKQQDGALVALSSTEATDPRLKRASRDFKSYGRAVVAKMRLERRPKDGGDNAA